MKHLLSLSLIVILFSSCGNRSNETKPEFREITETVFASGTLEPNDEYNLTAQSEGYITELNFIEGDIVKAGDVLAVVDNQQNTYNEKSAAELLSISKTNVTDNAPALKQTEENINLAKVKVKQDEAQASRYKKLVESNSVSKLEYENMALALETSRANLAALEDTYKLLKQQADQQLIAQQAQKNINSFFSENNKIKAIVGGKVYKKNKERGDYVRKGDLIAVIGHSSSLYAKLNVDESNISKVKLGQNALVQLNTHKEITLKGVVSEILPAFDNASQSFICKVKFTDSIPFLVEGTQLQANIVIGSKSRVLVIPRSYLDYENKVFIKGNDTPVKVKTGFVSTDWVEIIDGLKPEDVIVSTIK